MQIEQCPPVIPGNQQPISPQIGGQVPVDRGPQMGTSHAVGLHLSSREHWPDAGEEKELSNSHLVASRLEGVAHTAIAPSQGGPTSQTTDNRVAHGFNSFYIGKMSSGLCCEGI